MKRSLKLHGRLLGWDAVRRVYPQRPVRSSLKGSKPILGVSRYPELKYRRVFILAYHVHEARIFQAPLLGDGSSNTNRPLGLGWLA